MTTVLLDGNNDEVEELPPRHRRCTRCSVVKHEQAFTVTKKLKSGFDATCRACRSARRRVWREENLERSREIDRQQYRRTRGRNRDYILRTKYGITLEQYQQKSERQEGLCALCGKTPVGRGKDNVLHVDHDHDTNVTRDLLCSTCNSGLGFFQDNPELLEAAVAYLRRWGK